DLSVPGYPNIFVIGDAAHLVDEDGQPLPALAPVAMQQGKFLGKMLSKDSASNGESKFRYTNKGTMATSGRAKAVAEIRGFKISGVFAWFMWSFVHILQLMCFHNKTRVFLEWIWYYFTFKRGVRLITDRSGCKHCGEKANSPKNMEKVYSNFGLS